MTTSTQDIIVIKRVEPVEEKKKGGVWKIAHADFMTAMMAFFLIMWLVNATDEEIKKSIANYFNPLNLMAAPSDRRGVMDPTEDALPPASGDEDGKSAGNRPMASDNPGDGNAQDGGGNVEEGNQNTMASAGILTETDGPEFNDPFAQLASEASDLDPEVPTAVDVPQSTLGTEGVTSTSDEARDPFDPAYWQTARRRDDRSLRPGNPEALPEIDPRAVIDAADAAPTGAAEEPADPPQSVDRGNSNAVAPANGAEQDTAVAAPGPRSSVAEAVFATLGLETTEPTAAPSNESAANETAADSLTNEALEDIAAALEGTGAQVTIADAGSGGEAPVLISLTDESGGVSMFPIGSSVPNPDARAVFETVAQALSDRPGTIIVRGHTDARPFRGGTSDNWVLSFQRAHATKDALTANGIDEARIHRVEGLADREPSRPDDPLAAENRRIEILYEPSGAAQ